MDDLVGADAAVVRDDVLMYGVIVERDIRALGDMNLLRDRSLPLLRDHSRIFTGGDLCVRLVQVRQHQIVHRAVRDSRDARDHWQLVLRKHLVAVAVRDAVRLVVVVERDRLRLIERHSDVRAVGDAVQAVVLSPGAIDRNLIVVRTGRQVLNRKGVEAMIGRRHLRRHIGRSPLRAGAAEGLQIAAKHDIALIGKLGLLGRLALVVVGNLMRLFVKGERDLMIGRKAQGDIAAVRLAVLAVVQIPGAADSDLEVIVALLDKARDHAMALAVRLHDGLGIRGIPVLCGAQSRLHRADEHDVILLDRTGRARCLGFLRGRRRSAAGDLRRRLVRDAVIGERDLGRRRQLQLHVRAVARAVCAVVLIPRAADGDLVFVVALRQLAFILIEALADGLHLRLAVRRRPVRTGAELRLHRTDEHDILGTDRLRGLSDRPARHCRHDICWSHIRRRQQAQCQGQTYRPP